MIWFSTSLFSTSKGSRGEGIKLWFGIWGLDTCRQDKWSKNKSKTNTSYFILCSKFMFSVAEHQYDSETNASNPTLCSSLCTLEPPGSLPINTAYFSSIHAPNQHISIPQTQTLPHCPAFSLSHGPHMLPKPALCHSGCTRLRDNKCG